VLHEHASLVCFIVTLSVILLRQWLSTDSARLNSQRRFGQVAELLWVCCHAVGCLCAMCIQWLKWSCEAGGAHLTKPGWSKPIPIPHPTNLALFWHKITLYRFNQGAHTIAGVSNRSRWGPEPPAPTLTTVCIYCTRRKTIDDHRKQIACQH